MSTEEDYVGYSKYLSTPSKRITKEEMFEMLCWTIRNWRPDTSPHNVEVHYMDFPFIDSKK